MMYNFLFFVNEYQLNTVHLALIKQSIKMTFITLSLANNYLIGEGGGVQLPNPEPYVFFLGGFRVYSDSHVVH